MRCVALCLLLACTSLAMAADAVAVMTPTAGNGTTGTITFTKVDGGVQIDAAISGLSASGTHAIHVHQFGDARAADGTSAGDHYNPEGHDHGLPHVDERHAGDLGNLTADEQGNATLSLVVTNLSIDGHHNPVIGRSVIIHAKADDGGQPTGNAGPRIAIGVIGYAKPATPAE